MLEYGGFDAQAFGFGRCLLCLLARIEGANTQANEWSFVATHRLAQGVEFDRLQLFDGAVNVGFLGIHAGVEVVLAGNE